MLFVILPLFFFILLSYTEVLQHKPLISTLIGTASPACLCPAPGLPPPCPQTRTPSQPPRAVNPCTSDAPEGPVSSSPHPDPAWPWAPPNRAYLQAYVLALPWPVPICREMPDAWGRGCPRYPSGCLLLAGAMGRALPRYHVGTPQAWSAPAPGSHQPPQCPDTHTAGLRKNAKYVICCLYNGYFNSH